jgi:lysophospholipase L1-like esterase
MRKLIGNIVFIITLSLSAVSQNISDTLSFIHYDENKIFTPSTKSTQRLIQKFKQLNTQDAEQINIVHIGDSHLQAGFLTEQIKQQLFNHFCSDSVVSPGFIFPYAIAQTNNPFFYKVDYSGEWQWSKNVDVEKTSHLGLSGITVKTNDSLATFSITINQSKDSSFNKLCGFNTIKLLHNNNHSTSIKINNEKVVPEDKISSFNLNEIMDSVHFEITNTDTTKYFELYGIIMENTSSKINYHTIGVNGATAQSYLRCDYFSSHLACLSPDLIIISLGTNEAYDDHFSALEHEYILKDLIFQIQDIAPNTALLFITPNDHLKSEKVNNNVFTVRNNILKISKELNLNYWDFYSVMGGANSITDWYNKGLTGNDKLHFKPVGYRIQGDLFAKAFIHLIEQNK